MDNKAAQQLSNDEILRQQLELLAETSKRCVFAELPALTHAMVEVYKAITKSTNTIAVQVDGQLNCNCSDRLPKWMDTRASQGSL